MGHTNKFFDECSPVFMYIAMLSPFIYQA
jgi:ABC-type multidrug transport system ATPase subunit